MPNFQRSKSYIISAESLISLSNVSVVKKLNI